MFQSMGLKWQGLFRISEFNGLPAKLSVPNKAGTQQLRNGGVFSRNHIFILVLFHGPWFDNDLILQAELIVVCDNLLRMDAGYGDVGPSAGVVGKPKSIARVCTPG